MTMTRSTTVALLLGALALSIPATAPAAPQGEKPSFGSVPVRSVGKASAPVHWLNRAEYEAAAGGTVPVKVDFALTRPAKQVQVRIFAEAGLRLSEPELSYVFTDVPAGPLDIPAIDVAVDATGRHFLNAIVTIDIGGQLRGTAISIPVSTPGAKAAAPVASKALKTDASGQAVRVMQASSPR